jgi:tyrosinase
MNLPDRMRPLVIGLVALALGGLFACPKGEEKPPPPPTTSENPPPPKDETLYVRKEIHTYAPDSDFIKAYRKGVETMQARPASDKTSWLFQANMHGIPINDGSDQICSPGPPEPAPGLDDCQHGSFFFLSWHRMYLYYFERILRDASGDSDFALPYWNYAPSDQRAIPAVFREPTTGNSLYVSERGPGVNDGDDVISDADASAELALSRIPFYLPAPDPPANSFGGRIVPAPVHYANFYGQLERIPHNVIHNDLGGETGWMAWPECAARDPIFWLHHANIDRLWQVWLDQGGGRVNPTDQDLWMNHEFIFYDVGGVEVKMSGKQVLDTAVQLHYRYEQPPSPAAQALGATATAAPKTPGTVSMLAASPKSTGGQKLIGGLNKLKIAVPGDAGKTLLAGLAEKPTYLVLEGLQQAVPGSTYEVYLNLPAGAKPDPKGPYFAGLIALFGRHAKGDYELPLDGVLRGLVERKEWKGTFELTFVRESERKAGLKAAADKKVFLRYDRARIEQ